MSLSAGREPRVCGPSVCGCHQGRSRLAGLLFLKDVLPTLTSLPPPPPPPPRARMSAAECLAHPWLNNLAEKAKRCNRRLKSQILLKKYLMKRRWKVLLDRGGEQGGAAGQEEPLAPGPTSPALADAVAQARPCLENSVGFSLFVLGCLLTLHPPPPPWGGASIWGSGSGKGL